MARCIGPHCPYGWGHPEEHRAAAIKGWRTRREGRRLQHAARGFSYLTGSQVTQVHQHKQTVHFFHEGNFYELPRKEFDRLGREGHKIENAEARKWARGIIRSAHKAEKVAEEMRAAKHNPQQLEAARRAEYRAVVRWLKGRIKPARNPMPKSNKPKDKYLEYEEWQELPASVRSIKHGTITMDEAADEIERNFPWLRIHSDNDLIRYLRDKKYAGSTLF